MTAQSRPGDRRPAQLDDPAWLTQRLEHAGTASIALELGVSRKTVRLACERLNIPSHPSGRRRGRRITDSPTALTETIDLFAAHADSTAPAPTWTTVLGQLAAADTARKAHNRTSERNAAIALAVAAIRVAEHIDQAA